MLAFQYLVYWVFHLVYRVSSDLPSSFSIELLSCLTPFFKSVFALLDERTATSRPACLSPDLCLSMGLAGCHLLAQRSLNYHDPTVCLTVCRTVPFMAPFHLFSCFSCFFFFFLCGVAEHSAITAGALTATVQEGAMLCTRETLSLQAGRSAVRDH